MSLHLVIDIGDTITHAPAFFQMLTHGLRHARVTILTCREESADAAALLAELGIRYDRLITTSDDEFPLASDQALDEWKAATVAALGADAYFEDMPEVICRVTPPTKVFMACDEVMRDWLRQSLGR